MSPALRAGTCVGFHASRIPRSSRSARSSCGAHAGPCRRRGRRLRATPRPRWWCSTASVKGSWPHCYRNAIPPRLRGEKEAELPSRGHVHAAAVTATPSGVRLSFDRTLPDSPPYQGRGQGWVALEPARCRRKGIGRRRIRHPRGHRARSAADPPLDPLPFRAGRNRRKFNQAKPGLSALHLVIPAKAGISLPCRGFGGHRDKKEDPACARMTTGQALHASRRGRRPLHEATWSGHRSTMSSFSSGMKALLSKILPRLTVITADLRLFRSDSGLRASITKLASLPASMLPMSRS
jgi:hypothetical protein